jgi:acetyltransferase EpsM
MALGAFETAGNTNEDIGDIPPKAIFILGSGGFALELGVYFSTTYSAAIFYVDGHVDETNSNLNIISLNKYYEIMALNRPNFVSIMGSGTSTIKLKMLQEIREPLITFKHPQAVIYGKIGKGSVIGPCAVIAPNSVIGKHVLINYGASIGHNAIVEDLVVISPSASIGGRCKIGRGAYIGAGANIKEGLEIGVGATIGMGSVVIKNVPAGVTAVGVPARW